MFGRRRQKLIAVAALAVACAMGVSAYAFTASNTVPLQSAGAGENTVGGYTVSSPTNYTFNPAGTTIESVSFTLDKAASDVQVALTASTPTQTDWVDCGGSSGETFAVTCDFSTPIPVGDADELSVAAVSNGTVTIASS